MPLSLSLALPLAALLAFPATAGEPKEPAAPKKSDAAAPAMKIHVDPATGQLVPKPVAAPRPGLSAAPVEALPPLKVQKVTAKAGGKMVRLDDRFMMEMSASAGPDGAVAHDCAAEHEKAARAASTATEGRHDR